MQQVAKEYPDIEYEEMIVDNTCMQLASRPQQFDVSPVFAKLFFGSCIRITGDGHS